MKNMILKAALCMLAFCSMGSIQSGEPDLRTDALYTYAEIMNQPWSDRLENQLGNHGEWNFLTTVEKIAVLERLRDQALLSQYDVDSWDLAQAPAPFTMGG